MRLTLRTLLAWMDGTLEATQQAEMTTRVQSVASASALVARVQQSLETSGGGTADSRTTRHGADPNIVAAYLDNSLPSPAVVEFERVCLDSDQQLAEVAACHQVLARVSRGPVPVSRRLRERCHALGPATPTLDVGARGGHTPASPSGQTPARAAVQIDADQRVGGSEVTPGTVTPPPGPAATTFDETLPEFLRERPAAKWPWILVGGVILAGWLGLAVRTSPWGRRLGLPGSSPDVVVEQTEKNSPAGMPAGGETNARTVNTGSKEVSTEAEDNEAGGSERSAQVAEKMPDAAQETLDEDLPQRFARTPAGQTESEPPGPATESTPATPPADSASRVRVARFASPDGLAMAWDPDRAEWFLLPEQAHIHLENEVVVPTPFEAVFTIEGGLLQVWGGSRLGWTSGQPDQVAVCRFDLGRMILRASGAEGDSGLTSLLEVAGGLWRVELPPGASVGIEVWPVYPTTVNQPVRHLHRRGRIHVTSGQVRLTRLGEEVRTVTLTGTEFLDLRDELPQSGESDRRGPRPGGNSEWPEAPRRMTLTAKSASAQFRKLFTPGEGVEEPLLGAATGPEPRQSELATASLSMLGNTDALVGILQSTRHGESRVLAIAGLRRCLLDDEAQREVVRESLARRFAPSVAEQVERLLWGYASADARLPETANQLLEALSSSEIAVRELAVTHLRELTGRDFDYQPGGSEMQRSSAVRAWRQLIQRNDGSLLRGTPPTDSAPVNKAPGVDNDSRGPAQTPAATGPVTPPSDSP